MIHYQRGGANLLLNLFRTRGSVFPAALSMSIPASLVTALLVLVVHHWDLLPHFREEDSVMKDNAVWQGFNFLLGFLVVFRTSQAYNRFWEGVTNTYEMGAEWFNCCASLMAFTRTSKAELERVLVFKNTLIRLFSMLHAAALGEIEDDGETNKHDIRAFKMELIDAEGIDEGSLRAVRDSRTKVELIFQWIQQLVVESSERGVIAVPAPILTRSFQEIARGMVHFHDARRLSKIPFPFPYAVTCDCLLIVHWIVAPFVVSQWCPQLPWAMVFSFIQVFTLWSLNIIAVELENPFGSDPNDLDGRQMQHEMNNNLRMLCRPSTVRTPSLRGTVDERCQNTLLRRITRETVDKKRSFVQMWENIQEQEDGGFDRENSAGSDMGTDSFGFEKFSTKGHMSSCHWEDRANVQEIVDVTEVPAEKMAVHDVILSSEWKARCSFGDKNSLNSAVEQARHFGDRSTLSSAFDQTPSPHSSHSVSHDIRHAPPFPSAPTRSSESILQVQRLLSLREEQAKATGLLPPLPTGQVIRDTPRSNSPNGLVSPPRVMSPTGRPLSPKSAGGNRRAYKPKDNGRLKYGIHHAADRERFVSPAEALAAIKVLSF